MWCKDNSTYALLQHVRTNRQIPPSGVFDRHGRLGRIALAKRTMLYAVWHCMACLLQTQDWCSNQTSQLSQRPHSSLLGFIILGFTGCPLSPVPGGAMGVHAVRVEEAVLELAVPGASLEVVHLEPRGPWEGSGGLPAGALMRQGGQTRSVRSRAPLFEPRGP